MSPSTCYKRCDLSFLEQVYLSTQCDIGYLHPELYRSGSIAVALGVEAGPQVRRLIRI
jgi:hypothetical protein